MPFFGAALKIRRRFIHHKEINQKEINQKDGNPLLTTGNTPQYFLPSLYFDA